MKKTHGPYLLAFSKNEKLIPYLEKVGFKFPQINLANYPNLERHLLVRAIPKYLKEYKYLIGILNKRLENNELEPDEKVKMATEIETLV